MVFTYSFCNVSVMPVRNEPFHRAEQTDQLLFGEKAEVIEINDRDWARIRYTDYHLEGWCKAGQLQFTQRKEYYKPNKHLSATHSDRVVFEGAEMWLPLAAELHGVKRMAGRFKGKKVAVTDLEANEDQIKKWAFSFLNAPYQWGGKTIAGVDCSGLAQLVFKLCGLPLSRDSWQQATEGHSVDFLQSAKCGDLAFFDNAEGKIVHVGILLDEHNIIHATDTAGRVVVDRIDGGGIISKSLKKRTHNLRLVKRYF